VATTSLAQPAIPSQTQAALRCWRIAGLWHLTSLDAPTVAVVWTLAFAWAFNVHLPLWLPFTLAFATWSVYISDRILDAYRAFQPQIGVRHISLSRCRIDECRIDGLRPRHHFHWQHRRLFIPTAAAAAGAALALVLINMPLAARTRNTVLAVAAIVYFTSVHNPWRLPSPKFRLRIPKELLVALIFTLACVLPAWARISTGHLRLLAPSLTFIALAWLNCHAIETWESMPRRSSIFPLAASLTTLALLAAIVLAVHHPRLAILEAAAAASAALLAQLDRQQQRLAPTTLRALADLVLLTPLALLALPLFRP
jgi:hypothetical protein